MEFLLVIFGIFVLIAVINSKGSSDEVKCHHDYEQTDSHYNRGEGKRTMRWTCKKCGEYKERVTHVGGYSFYK